MTDNQNNQYMVAFDMGGGVRWMVPNETPQIATADGGVIGASGITYDQNGNAAGQTTLFTQSWRGNLYQDGPLTEVFQKFVDAAKSLWAHVGGSPSGNNAAARQWNFKLVWQNNCSGVPQPCGFTLYPDDPAVNLSLAIDATSQATAIKDAALKALKRAFMSYPVLVSEGTTGTGDHEADVLDGENYIVQPNTNDVTELCGLTPNQGAQSSMVWYRKHMEQAQWALGIKLITAQDVQNALGRLDLMNAIGTGIGNTAAHEIGHQFFGFYFGMEDSSVHTYNGAAGCDGLSGGGFWYGVGPISWENVTANAWAQRPPVGLGTGFQTPQQ